MYSEDYFLLLLQESDGEKSDENLVVDVGDVSPFDVCLHSNRNSQCLNLFSPFSSLFCMCVCVCW